MCKVAKKKLLVAFQTDARCKIIEVFLIGYWTALVDTSDIELLWEVQRKYSIVIYLTEDWHIGQVLNSFAERESGTCYGVEIHFLNGIAFTFLQRLR